MSQLRLKKKSLNRLKAFVEEISIIFQNVCLITKCSISLENMHQQLSHWREKTTYFFFEKGIENQTLCIVEMSLINGQK